MEKIKANITQIKEVKRVVVEDEYVKVTKPFKVIAMVEKNIPKTREVTDSSLWCYQIALIEEPTAKFGVRIVKRDKVYKLKKEYRMKLKPFRSFSSWSTYDSRRRPTEQFRACGYTKWEEVDNVWQADSPLKFYTKYYRVADDYKGEGVWRVAKKMPKAMLDELKINRLVKHLDK
jgi:hypothetical protein